MSLLLVQTPHRTWDSALPTAALIGRHRSCTVVVDDPSVPLFWLEVRWTGSQWAWRPLAGADHTVGRGELLTGDWRRWATGPTSGVRLREVRLRLLEPRAPGAVVQWLEEGRCEPLPLAHTQLSPTPLGGLLWRSRPEAAPAPVSDGAVVQLGGRPCRIWLPEGWATTDSPGLAVDAPGMRLDFSAEPTAVTLTLGTTSVELRSEEVRLLRVYAEARAADPRGPECGYRRTDEAFSAWVSLGGNPDSSPERLSWMRHRLRTQLDALGVAAADALFDRRRRASRWQHRLALDPETLHLPAEDG